MMNKKIVSPIRIWGKPRRMRLWERCLDVLQHGFVIAAFVLFLSYVQTVAAVEISTQDVTHVLSQ